MALDRSETNRPAEESEWARSDRISARTAMAIALCPIPIALVISWAMGDPPWRAKADRKVPPIHAAPVDHQGPGPEHPELDR